ncbi:lysozyme inhibitor LprI family protein [Pararhodobacter marinus]|uniref:lysozyme inhibitor LprI family protein n=1 Tax=Pararhodobacter marinus TaxID=2184063 RepID=UPI00351955C1
MRRLALAPCLTLLLCASAALADPEMECPGGSQIEIGACLRDTLERVDDTVETAYSYALIAAAEIDSATGRPTAAPALEAAQGAWNAYRDAHCAYIGETFSGGSGTSLGIASCRIMLGRDRVATLLELAR